MLKLALLVTLFIFHNDKHLQHQFNRFLMSTYQKKIKLIRESLSERKTVIHFDHRLEIEENQLH